MIFSVCMYVCIYLQVQVHRYMHNIINECLCTYIYIFVWIFAQQSLSYLCELPGPVAEASFHSPRTKARAANATVLRGRIMGFDLRGQEVVAAHVQTTSARKKEGGMAWLVFGSVSVMTIIVILFLFDFCRALWWRGIMTGVEWRTR